MGTSTTWPTACMRPRSRKSWTIAAASRFSWTGKQRAQEWIILRVFHFALDLVSCAWRTKWTCGATKIGRWTGWHIIFSSSHCLNRFWSARHLFWAFFDLFSWKVKNLVTGTVDTCYNSCEHQVDKTRNTFFWSFETWPQYLLWHVLPLLGRGVAVDQCHHAQPQYFAQVR